VVGREGRGLVLAVSVCAYLARVAITIVLLWAAFGWLLWPGSNKE
jgi:hypothetical protein